MESKRFFKSSKFSKTHYKNLPKIITSIINGWFDDPEGAVLVSAKEKHVMSQRLLAEKIIKETVSLRLENKYELEDLPDILDEILMAGDGWTEINALVSDPIIQTSIRDEIIYQSKQSAEIPRVTDKGALSKLIKIYTENRMTRQTTIFMSKILKSRIKRLFGLSKNEKINNLSHDSHIIRCAEKMICIEDPDRIKNRWISTWSILDLRLAHLVQEYLPYQYRKKWTAAYSSRLDGNNLEKAIGILTCGMPFICIFKGGTYQAYFGIVCGDGLEFGSNDISEKIWFFSLYPEMIFIGGINGTGRTIDLEIDAKKKSWTLGFSGYAGKYMWKVHSTDGICDGLEIDPFFGQSIYLLDSKLDSIEIWEISS